MEFLVVCESTSKRFCMRNVFFLNNVMDKLSFLAGFWSDEPIIIHTFTVFYRCSLLGWNMVFCLTSFYKMIYLFPNLVVNRFFACLFFLPCLCYSLLIFPNMLSPPPPLLCLLLSSFIVSLCSGTLFSFHIFCCDSLM